MIQYGVVLFHTTSAVMRAEKLLIKGGFTIKLIPVPRQFSSDCGVAIRFDWSQHWTLKTTLDNAGIEYAGIHFMGSK